MKPSGATGATARASAGPAPAARGSASTGASATTGARGNTAAREATGAATRPRARTAPTAAPRTRRGQTVPGDGAKATKPGKVPRKKRGFFRRYWWTFLVVPLVLFLGLLGALIYAYQHIEIPTAPPPALTTYVYDRHGDLITRLHAAVNRTEIPLKEVPLDVRHAVLAAEDKGFYQHGAINFWAILRAGWNDVVHHGETLQGGSTITQQYVKNVYTDRSRSIIRKIKEAMISVKLEKKFSKDEIFEKYLNTIYFGHGAYGIQAAAQTYFHRAAKELNIAQGALLAGIINSPAGNDPVTHPDRARARRAYVLDEMVDSGWLSQSQADALKQRPVDIVLTNPATTGKAAYFSDYTRRWLIDNYGEQLTYTGGLKVTSSLDLKMQHIAEKAVAAHLPSPDDPSAALVAIDPRTGEIRAMVGGPDPHRLTNKENLAVPPSRRQAGSAFKPFTLAAALSQKLSLTQLWNGPNEITIDDPRCYTTDPDTGVYGPWDVSNAADEEAGTFNLMNATAFSVNTIYAQLVTQLANGPKDVVRWAHRLGVDSPLKPVCSITLGTQEVSPLEMTEAYATLAARGVRHEGTPIHDVRDSNGDPIVLGNVDNEGKRVMDQNDADMETYILEHVVEYGTGTAADIGRPVAGKTGTGQNFSNAWFCGYTPQLATCVWVGYHQGNIPMENVEGFSEVFGGTIPAQIFHDFMVEALEGQPVLDFPQPDFNEYTNLASISPVTTPPPTTVSPSPSPTESPSPSPTESPTPTETQTTTAPPTTTPPPTTPPPTTPPPTTPPPTTPPPTTPPTSSPSGKPTPSGGG